MITRKDNKKEEGDPSTEVKNKRRTSPFRKQIENTWENKKSKGKQYNKDDIPEDINEDE